jgi:DNA-binding MarR family transcriptional regulator
LAQHQDVSLPSMSDTVQTLVERGWLERDQSAEDRRVMQVRINRKGQQVLANEHKRLVGLMAERLETLTTGELDQIEKSLASLLSVFGAPSSEKSVQQEKASRN